MAEKRRSGQVWSTLFFLALITAMELFFFRSVLGTDALPGNDVDSRLNNLIMEHWYHFLRGKESFSSLSEFYPVTGTVSYTDMLLGYSILYCPLRFLGFSIFQAGKLTILLLHAIGSFSFFYFLKKELKTGSWAALLGVICFSFANGYALRIAHTQMAALSLIPLILICASRALRKREKKAGRRFWTWLAVSGTALLAYTGWYSFFFLMLFLFLSAIAMLLSLRITDRELLKTFAGQIRPGMVIEFLLFLLYFALCLIPFLRLYLPTAKMSGGRSWQDVVYFLPGPADLFNLGEGNLLFGPFFQSQAAAGTGSKGVWELTQGFPLPEIILLIVFLILFIVHDRNSTEKESWFKSRPDRKRNAEQKKWLSAQGMSFRMKRSCIYALAGTVLFSFILAMEIGGFSLWYLVWRCIPGASAIRAAARWYYFLLLPLSVLMALLAENIHQQIRSRNFWPGERLQPQVLLMMSGCALLLWICNINKSGLSLWTESSQQAFLDSTPLPPEEAEVIAIMDSSGTMHEWPYVDHLNAWMLADHLGIKTVNGYSGQVPKDYPLQDITAYDYINRILLYKKNTGLEEDVWVYDLGNGEWSLASTAALSLNTEYSFSEESWGYFSGAWHACESWGRWMADSAELSFSLTAEDLKKDNLVLTLHLRSYAKDQKLKVLVNGEKKGSFVVGPEEERHKIRLSGESLKVYNKISFILDGEALSPAELEEGNGDNRKLGVGFISFKIREK